MSGLGKLGRLHMPARANKEGAVAYDLAVIIKGKAPNHSIGDREFLIPLAPEIKESIKKVEKRITGHIRSSSGNGFNQVGSYKADRKKVVRRANEAASTLGSGAKKRGWEVKEQ